jgi:tetratricopeptide (TPR) repeat protein
MTKAPASALKHAKIAYSLYTDSLYKSDASRMLAEAYYQNNFVDSAIMFYEKAEDLDSTTTNNIASLLNIYLKTSNIKANDIFIKLYKIDPTNPSIYNQLERIYSNNAKEYELINKYEALLISNSNDFEIVANLKYYLARLYSLENTELAIATYLESKASFEKIYKADHPVFNSIEKSIEQLKEIKK